MTSDKGVDPQEERREFFRIDDSLLVSYSVLEDGQRQRRLDEQAQGMEDRFTIMTRMQAISQHLSASLHRIEQRDADVADYLKALDEKINLLGESFLAEETDLMDQPSKPVNLSAGGLALDSSESLDLGTVVEIKLLLLPSYTGIVAFGEVVGVEKEDGNPAYPHRLRINFSHIRDADRDALIRHILRRQGQMLRQERQRQESTG